MDIGSGHGYPASNLSNFQPYKFEVDGIECNSMEGFLQSLKFKDENIQEGVCKLVGKKAKFKGKKKKWFLKQELYWKGKIYKRDSKEYQELLDKAYNSLAKNKKFQKTLLATQNAKALGQAFGHVVAAGVVDDVFGLHDVAGHRVQ